MLSLAVGTGLGNWAVLERYFLVIFSDPPVAIV